MFWGLSGGIGGMLMADGWSASVVAFYRGGIGLLCVLVWLALRPHNSGLSSWHLWFWAVIAGLGIAGNFAFYFLSISEGSVAVAATLMYCAPVFGYIISFALKMEQVTAIKLAAIMLVMIGIILLTGIYDAGASTLTPLAITAGLLSGVSYAVFIFGFKNAVLHGSPQAILVIAFATLSLIIFPGAMSQIVGVLHSPRWPLFVLLGLLGAGFSFALYIHGLKHIKPSIAAVVAMVEPVTASLFGVIVLGETLLGIQVFGMVLVVVTVTLLGVRDTST
jgi:drug/metabolite transporter (DMT)-like permease